MSTPMHPNGTLHTLRRFALLAGLVLASATSTGCKKNRPGEGGFEGPGGGAEQDPRAEARDVFAQRCAACHGQGGAGDGPAAAGLTPRPRNFHDPAWQRQISDADIERIIQYGGAAVGKSALMPANPDLQNRPAVVSALREQIRALAPAP